MRTKMIMKRTNSAPTFYLPAALRRIAGIFVLAAFASTAAMADVVYVTSLKQGVTTSTLPTDGSYTETGITLGYTGAKGTASGRPVTGPASRAYLSSAIFTSTTGGVDIKPTLALNNWVYQIDYNWGNSGLNNASTNVVLALSTTGGTLSSNSTPVFQRDFANTTAKQASWLFVGYITNTTATPTISFRYQSGLVTATAPGNRLIFDCWRFTAVSPCLSVAAVGIDGPLATNLPNVTVTGVSATATNITLYQNAGTGFTNIGSLAVASPAATVVVPVSGRLIKSAQVGATQTINGQEGCVPTAGTPVGGGASPRIRIAASIRQPGGLAGPIGADGGGPTADIYWIHATGANVAGGIVVQPSTCWQTIIFHPNTDSKFLWNNNADGLVFPDPNQFGILEGFGIAMDDLTDTGPFNIYFDNIRNGSTMIQDFEGNSPGAAVMLRQPSFSSTTSGNILTTPNSAGVSNGNAASGTNSSLVKWQWNGSSSANWLRLNSSQSGGAVSTPNPQVDLSQPILVDILVLPVNATTGHSLGLITPMVDQTNCPGDTVTFTLPVPTAAPETGPYTYQWKFKGVTIAGATDNTFTTNGVGPGSAGKYSVVISDGTCSTTVDSTLTMKTSVSITDPSNPMDVTVNVGDPFDLFVSASSSPCGGSLTYQWRLAGTNIANATAADYFPSSAQVGDAGLYYAVVSSPYQSVTSRVALVHVIDGPNQIVGSGTGLLGMYYSNHLAAAPFTGADSWEHIDPNITTNPPPEGNMNWLLGAPDACCNTPSLVSTDHFTVRWMGQLQPEWGQTYTFYSRSDDGFRLWVAGKLVIDSWIDQGPAVEHSGVIALGPGLQDIIVEYYENGGGAQLDLSWESASQIKGVIPQNDFYPAASVTLPTVALTAPTGGSIYTTNATVTLSATVVTNHFAIKKVQFYRGTSTLIGESTGPAFSFNWVHPPAGAFNIFARVVYDEISTADSSANSITVINPSPAYLFAPAMAGVNLNISGTGAVGEAFILQTTPTLSPQSWSSVSTNSSGSGSFGFLIDPAAFPQSFFRVLSR